MGGVVVNNMAWLTAELGSKGLMGLQSRILESVNGNTELENIVRNFGCEIIKLSKGFYISSSGIASVLIAKEKLYESVKIQPIKNRTMVSMEVHKRRYKVMDYQSRPYMPLANLGVFLENCRKEILGPLTLANYGARMADMENITKGHIKLRGIMDFSLSDLVVTYNTLAILGLKTSRELEELRGKGAVYETISKIGDHSSRIYYPLDALGNERLAELPLDKVYIKDSLFLKEVIK